MQETIKTRTKVSFHLNDLLKRDVQTVVEVANWLEKNAVKPRDIANRTVSKRMLARLIAAKLALKACEGDVQASKEVMDRTEGKVADRLITVDVNDLVQRLEAARQRVLSGYRVGTETLQLVDSKDLVELALDAGSSVEGQLVESQASPATRIDPHRGPPAGVESETPPKHTRRDDGEVAV